MNPLYRFFLQKDEGEKVPVNPVYNDDLTLEYALESSEQFYRATLSGKLNFVRDDFRYIMQSDFETTFYVYIEKSNNNGIYWDQYFVGKFVFTDCTVNLDNEMITTKLETVDQYVDVLNGYEKEFNVVDITPTITPIRYDVRPIFQVYRAGDSVVSNYQSGIWWEQDVLEEVDDEDALNQKYIFAKSDPIRAVYLANTTVQADVEMPKKAEGLYQWYNTNSDVEPDYTYGFGWYRRYEGDYYNVRFTYHGPDDPSTFDLMHWNAIAKEWEMLMQGVVDDKSVEAQLFQANNTATLRPVPGSGAIGSMFADATIYTVWMRTLVAVDKVGDTEAYTLPAEDIVATNKNYKKAIPYKIEDQIVMWGEFSDEPTEWGLAPNGKYYTKPTDVYGYEYYPIQQSYWGYGSLWFKASGLNTNIDQTGSKQYWLQDAYQISDVIKAFLQQIAPNIQHDATDEYSRFLYGQNPLSTPDSFRLFITQKTNVINGPYTMAAKKAPATLKQIFQMLQNVYRCYWFIDGDKLRIEHVSWFMNGGSYAYSKEIGVDLTKLRNITNGKSWEFGASEYSYDKLDMPKQYEFEWMDDVSAFFTGEPLIIQSKYVQEDKTEKISISNFTSDLDLMLLDPSNMSSDGFALLTGRDELGSVVEVWSPRLSTDFIDFEIAQSFRGKPLHIGLFTIANADFKYSYVFMSGDYMYGDPEVVTQKEELNIETYVPNNAKKIRFMASEETGTVVVTIRLNFEGSGYVVPYVDQRYKGAMQRVQNGFAALAYVEPKFWLDNMPAKKLLINGVEYTARSISKKKKQTVSFPVGNDDPDVGLLIKTSIGNGEIEKISLNLASRMGKFTLKYDTE